MKKYVEILIFGFVVLIFGILALWFETNNYNYKNTLPITLKKSTMNFTLQIEDDKEYVFGRGLYNKNINIIKRIDNSVSDKIVVEAIYYDTSELLYTYDAYKDMINVSFYNKLLLNDDDIPKIYDIFIKFVSNKTIYNYNLLKYSNINIYVSEENSDNVKVLNNIDEKLDK